MTSTAAERDDLFHDSLHRLTWRNTETGATTAVFPQRLFPLSDPDSWISLRDDKGHEIVCYESIRQLNPTSRAALQLELDRQEFTPRIQRIIRVSGDSEPTRWEVETDRGATSFVLGAESDVRRLGTYGVMITDTSRIRYQVPDQRALDSHSRQVLEWYV